MPTDNPARIRPFADVLRELRRGRLHDELSEALRDLTLNCRETGKAGTLTLTLKLTPSDASLYAHIEVVDTVTVKPPKPAVAPSIFFADDDANLVRSDPRQQQLSGLQAVDTETGEILDDERGAM